MATATAAEQILAPAEREQQNLWTDAWRRLRRNRLALIAALYIVFLLAVAITSFFWTPYPYTRIGVTRSYGGPTLAHPFGGDYLGRDILSRIMVGAQAAIEVGVGTQIVVLVVGVTVGLLAGYFRGWFDAVITFIINVFYGIPNLLVALIIVVITGRSGVGNIIFAIAVTGWMDMARLVRGQTLSIREREFIEAAKSSGAKPGKIIFGHIFPNALGPIIVQATLGIPTAILFEAFLSFLGLGIPPPQPSWGSMAKEGVDAIR